MTNEHIVSRGTGTATQKLWLALVAFLALAAHPGMAGAANIYVTTNGPPLATGCSLTQAIQAALTDAPVGGWPNRCAAGHSKITDTIWLAANTVYTDYGAPLHIPASSGPVIIRGQGVSGGEASSIIRGVNYGYPSPNPLNQDVCQYPAAIYAGHNYLTLRDVRVQAKPEGTGHMGICQYSGTLTLNNAPVGDGAGTYYFNRGGIWSFPNTQGNHRNLTIMGGAVWGNVSYLHGGGIALHGSMTVSISETLVYDNWSNESGGGLSWVGSGTLSISGAEFTYNRALYSYGGAMNLNPELASSTATLANVDVQQNSADYHGGAIWVGYFLPNNLRISNGSYFIGNSGTQGNGVPHEPKHNTFNADTWVYDAIWCTGGSYVGGLGYAPWTSNNPRLKGDGSCTF
jgi:hypothetical protein